MVQCLICDCQKGVLTTTSGGSAPLEHSDDIAGDSRLGRKLTLSCRMSNQFYVGQETAPDGLLIHFPDFGGLRWYTESRFRQDFGNRDRRA